MAREDYEQRKELLRMERENFELKHKMKMEELNFERATQVLFFENQMSVHRIKRADRRNEFRDGKGRWEGHK